MNNTPASSQAAGGAPRAQPEQGPAQAGAPGDSGTVAQAREGDKGAPYSGSLQTRGAAQGQVSGRQARRGQASQELAMRPPVDIFEDETGVTLLADMPGVSREQLELRVDGDTLVIEGTAAIPEVGEMELVHGEMLSPHYQRSFTLSRDLDPQKIDAKLSQGVLTLRLHKAEQAKPRRIEVQGG